MEFILLINVLMPTMVGILTFMIRIQHLNVLMQEISLFFSILVFMKIWCSVELSMLEFVFLYNHRGLPAFWCHI